MADASSPKSKTGGRATGDATGASATTSTAGTKGKKKRRLGRGLGSLLSTAPVDLDSGKPRQAVEQVEPAADPAPKRPKSGGRLAGLAGLAAPTGPGGIALPGDDPPPAPVKERTDEVVPASQGVGEEIEQGDTSDKVQVRLLDVELYDRAVLRRVVVAIFLE